MDNTIRMLSNKLYYAAKPFLPRRLLLMLRRWYARIAISRYRQVWPICRKSSKPPREWSGWPEQKKFALVLTHDIECSRGLERCEQLVRLEERLGFRSCVFLVPEKYQVSPNLRYYLTSRGFEVGVHGLKHDGKLYSSKREFQRRAVHIKRYLEEWNSVGFRSPSMHHKLDWLCRLDIEYDSSTFDTDPFEPQPDGMETIFPFWVPGDEKRRGYVELPHTIPQDWTLFVLLKERSIEVWKKKLDWIAQHGGMALLITHPDYMNWDAKRLKWDEYPVEYYEDFLNYVKSKYKGKYWHVLPSELEHFWVKNMKSGESQVPKGHLKE